MSPRRIAWTVWFVTIGLVALVWAFAVAAVPAKPLPEEELDIGWYAFMTAGVLLYATVGALITSRQMGNRVGLLFSWVALTAAVGGASGNYTLLALERDLALVAPSAWVAQVAFAAMIGPLAFLFLIFPTGRPPSRRWGWVGSVMLGAYTVTIVLFAITPGPLEAGFAEQHSIVLNPIALPSSWERQVEALTTFAGSIVFVGALISILSLFQRYRGAATIERQQIRWLAWLGGSIVVYLLAVLSLELTGVAPDEGPWADIPFIVMVLLVFVGIPITCAVAILRHGLWDLDVVIKKTVQYGVLVVAFTAVVGGVLVVAPAAIIGVGANVGDAVPFLIGALIAIGIMLARSRARRWANRIVYGKRSSPYEVLSEFAERVGETYSTEDVLPRMAQLLGEATGARIARVWLRVGSAMRADASWPLDAASVPDVEVEGDELPLFGNDHAFEVRHRGELLGALTVTAAPDDPMNLTKTKLATDMASQAGLVLRNVRLIEDLRESRRRIVAAQDVRAKKLERDIHDGAQQQLVALQVKQRLTDSMIDRDPARAHDMMAELQRDAASALEELRDLARGIYPPLLADQGLAAALDSQARRSPVPVEIHPDGIGRYSPEIEAAVYFSCLEALQNVAKYADATRATVTLRSVDDFLSFEVMDDGRGFDPEAASRGSGLQGMTDRMAALGGDLEVRSVPGSGTTVSGRVPVSTRGRS